MSCDHNTTEFKYCPECGIKIDNDELAVKELNDIYIDYKKKLNALGITEALYSNFKLYLQKNDILKSDVIYSEVENKFYSKSEYIKYTNDKNISYLAYTELYHESGKLYKIYTLYDTLEYIRNDVNIGLLKKRLEQKVDNILEGLNKESKEKYGDKIREIIAILYEIKLPKGLFKNMLCNIIDEINE
jgi:hypothetical protein